MKIGIDVDGVIADSPFTPREDRTTDYYLALPAYKGAAATVNKLSANHDVWIISARCYTEAWISTVEWLKDIGVYLPRLKGVITGVEHKIPICSGLEIAYLFDDNPKAENQLYLTEHILVKNPIWPENLELYEDRRDIYRVESINQIPDFLKREEQNAAGQNGF